MTEIDARKILGISGFTGRKSTKRAYLKKCRTLQRRMSPGYPCSDRQQAQAELVILTDAWRTVQTKQPKRKKHTKPKTTTNRQKSAMQTTVWDIMQDIVKNFEVMVGMTSLSKTTVRAILITEFVLLMITLVLKSMKGA